MKNNINFIYCLILCLLSFSLTNAQTGNEQISQDTTVVSQEGDFKTRQTLTGKWGGLRPKLREKGLLFKVGFSNYYQGMVSGEGNNDFEYGSKLGFTTILNGKKLGLWEGFFTIVRLEYNMGHSVNNRGGTVLPVNTALAYPGIEGSDRFDMNIYFVQFLSKTDKIVLGKINNIDLGNFSSFSGGLGIKNFQNNVFVGPPNGITVPYVFGAYYLSSNEKRDLTFAFYDSNSRVNKIGFQDLFQDGVTFFGSANLVTHFFGKKGKQGLLGAISTKQVRNLNDLESFFPPMGNYISEKSNRWTLGYFFEQTLYENSENKNQKFGVFGQAGLTDGKGSFADYYLVLGISGNSPITKRPLDRWGIGYSYYSFSDGLSEFNVPTIPGVFPGLVVDDGESTFEAYYEAQITPWVSLGINYQLISPGVTQAFGKSNNSVSFLGFRSLLKL
jgi:porin